jgi:hypothetical protein
VHGHDLRLWDGFRPADTSPQPPAAATSRSHQGAPASAGYLAAVQAAKDQLRERGLAQLDGFLTPAAVAELAALTGQLASCPYSILMRMFDKKAQAEALILADEGSGNIMDTDMHGVKWDHHKYIVEVRPPGEEPFRIQTKAKVPIFSAPQPGDVVTVSYDPKNRKTEIQIEGDPRYDPKVRRANSKQRRTAEAEALLSGKPVPAAAGVVHHLNVVDDDEPRWIVPATCPECGARIDQSRASMAEHPACPYCAKPLPCRPVR